MVHFQRLPNFMSSTATPDANIFILLTCRYHLDVGFDDNGADVLTMMALTRARKAAPKVRQLKSFE